MRFIRSKNTKANDNIPKILGFYYQFAIQNYIIERLMLQKLKQFINLFKIDSYSL